MPRPNPTRSTAFTRRATAHTRVAAIAIAAATLALAPCNGPQSPATRPDAAFQGAFDGVVLEFQLEQGGGTSPLELVARDLTYDPATAVLTAQVALRNTSGVAVPGPASVTVWDFDPPSVQPENAACTECVNCVITCSFDHSGTYGEDGLLAPGETSTPRAWSFHDPGPQSFSFRARIATDPTPQAGFISGVIFLDENRNGERDPGDPGMPGRPVTLQFGDVVRTTQSNDAGRFRFEVTEPGLYVVTLVPTDFCVETTPPQRNVLIVRQPDGSLSGYDGVDFGCRGDAPPDSSIAVGGAVFEDANRNGVRDRGEPGLAGVLVIGSVPSCPTFAPIEARTDERGLYALLLPPCAPPYVVHRAPLAGFVDTSPNPLVFERPAPRLEASFGVAPTDSSIAPFIEGIVFEDSDGDGTLDPDEPRLAEVEVWAGGYRCLLPVVALGRTDAQGRYRLRGADVLCDLPWIVRRAPIPRHCDTTPNPVIVEPAPGDPTVFRVDFGSQPCRVP
jgi:hypothetical protein